MMIHLKTLWLMGIIIGTIYALLVLLGMEDRIDRFINSAAFMLACRAIVLLEDRK